MRALEQGLERTGAVPDRPSHWTDLREFVALDLETTGFDRLNDRIIEVGAVRFDRSSVIERFRTFVDPGRPIPREVRLLTSIEDADVAGAPTPTLALSRLASFVGASPVVGHNVQFDLDFLASAGLELPGTRFDTWELASVLMPTAGRLHLGALRERLGLEEGTLHRALADAESTADVFRRLLVLLDRQPRAVLLDLEAFALSAGWASASLFTEALARADAGAGAGRRAEALALPPPPEPWSVVAPRFKEGGDQPERRPVPADIEAVFAVAATRADLFPGFERRAGQTEMALAVAEAHAHGGHLAIEAGTGTGKSLAYLVPSLLHALRTGERTLVSTHTLNLQEQLASRELPLAARLVEAATGVETGTLRWTVLKGRANYLCLERWAEARTSPAPRTPAEARLHARIATWLPVTETGDLGELYMPSDERGGWTNLSAADVDCLTRRCAFVQDGSCFLLRSRQRAAGSHVVVANHALLLADARAGSTVLPPAPHLVIDEAHRLEGVATDQFGSALSLRDLRALVEEVASGGAVTGRLQRAALLDDAPLSPLAGLTPLAGAVRGAASHLRETLPAVDRALRRYAQSQREDRGGLDAEAAIPAPRASQPMWEDVEEAAIQLDLALIELQRRVADARDAVQSLPEGSAPGTERLALDLGRLRTSVLEARDALHAAVLARARGVVRWTRVTEADAQLFAAPLDVADQLAGEVYGGRTSVVATSATLAAGDSFEFAVSRLGLDEAETMRIPSPFDYRRAVLVLVATDVPEPDAPGHAAAQHDTLRVAAEAAGGRTLALFTSHGAVRHAAGALRGSLARAGVTVLAQQLDGSPGRLIEQLVEQPRTLLLGTSAFWEGVDIRGDTLSQIAVARLPFPVPDDPIHAARAEAYDDPFQQYSLPQALLRFRQGFGRLIRGAEERGVVLILDRRVLTRRYGEAFLDALPDCEVRRLPTSAIGPAIADWLGRP